MRAVCHLICVRLFFVLLYVVVGSVCTVASDDATDVRETTRVKVKKLSEISGIAASRQNPGIFWLHNDGPSRLLYAVDNTGKLVALVSWPNEIADFEDMAIGPGPKAGADYLYVGDIGDNDSRRAGIRIVRFAEPKMSDVHNGQMDVETTEEFRFKYPDEPHNAEALVVDPMSGDIFVVTKDHRNARVYTCSANDLKEKATEQLKLVGTLDLRKVSGGAIARDGSRIILRREDQGWLWNRARGESIADALKRHPKKIAVRDQSQGPNGEAVAFSPAGTSYFTVSEGKNQTICEFPLPGRSVESSR